MKSITFIVTFLALLVALPTLGNAADAPAGPALKYFVIILHPVPRLYQESAWTEADNAAVGAHFNRLKEATAAGRVLLAGRTNEPLDKTFGLVVFSATDETEARAFMEGDPCVAAGVMTAELHPYGLALRAK